MSDNQLKTREPTDLTKTERTRGGVYFTPRVDILENDRDLTLIADVPGATSEGVDLRYENGELILHCRVPERVMSGTMLVNEYLQGDFYRAFSIHESIDHSRIEASCKNGVLTVHLPKVAAAQPKQIQVKAS
jgi:HSP20 family protein